MIDVGVYSAAVLFFFGLSVWAAFVKRDITMSLVAFLVFQQTVADLDNILYKHRLVAALKLMAKKAEEEPPK